MLTLIRGGLNLRLFDGGEAAGTGSDGQAAAATTAPAIPEVKSRAPKNPLADVKYGKQPEDKGDQSKDTNTTDAPKDTPKAETETDREARFEALIKGDFKDLYNKRVEGLISDRIKHAKGLEAQLKDHTKIAKVLATKYDIDPADVKALAKAVSDDNSYYEELADQLGLPSPDLAKELVEARNLRAEAIRAEEERDRRVEMDQKMRQWHQDAELVKQQLFPNLDFFAECNNPETGRQFLSMLHSGVPVRNAYQALHQDEIIGGAMQHTAQTVAKKITDDIRTRGMRPVENGASGQAAASVKPSVKGLTRSDHAEINRRLARGEKISF